jgi:hypothetical protein
VPHIAFNIHLQIGSAPFEPTLVRLFARGPSRTQFLAR